MRCMQQRHNGTISLQL
ncbi:hypothetical protein Gotur_029644 [Gossypium turneri]